MSQLFWSCLTVTGAGLACLIGLTEYARSCDNKCEYSDSFGICWPYAGCVPGMVGDTANSVLDLGPAILSGDSENSAKAWETSC
jgi:hypothetical protein